MSGLPKLPGLTFQDPTQTKFNLQHTFHLCNGYKFPKTEYCGIGGKDLTVKTLKYLKIDEPIQLDPSLIYGRLKSPILTQFVPHYVLYDQKCLTFKAFFKQSVTESPNEFWLIRYVNIIYFLEDDTITVMEPKIKNSGMNQGRLIRRGKIHKNMRGDFWHWKDLNIGKDISFNGIVFHTVDCDLFTKEYFASQGVILGEIEIMPVNIPDRVCEFRKRNCRNSPRDDKLRRFLEYDGKVLKFNAACEENFQEYRELRKYIILYFLYDNTITVKEVHERNDGMNPSQVLLKKIKLPKSYTDTPVNYPAIYLELSDAEVSEYYQPKDFLIGENIFVLGRNMLIYDCDRLTRDYFKNALRIEQKKPITIEERKPLVPPPLPPSHSGIGKPPKKDIMKQMINANKFLRYEMVMDWVHPEDTNRRFILSCSLADGTCKIMEPPIRNSGITGGRYLRSSNLIKPGSNPLNPDFYTPVDFYIGATITVFEQRFKIVGADLYVYRYMQANEGKFPCEVIENMRNYMFNKGYLNDDVQETISDNLYFERKWDLEKPDEIKETDMEKCLKKVKVGGENFDSEYEQHKRAEVAQQYEDSIKRKPLELSHGISSVKKVCAHPVCTGDVKEVICNEDDEGYQSYTPDHVDTPEEITAKYYMQVLKDHHDICDAHPIACIDLPPRHEYALEKTEIPTPIRVAKPDIIPDSCNTVTFAEGHERDKYDLCGLKTKENCA